MSGQKQNAPEISTEPKAAGGRLANWGGYSYLAGDGVQLVTGLGNLQPNQIASSLTFFGAAGIYSRYGHRDGGFALGSTLSIIGMTVATLPGILDKPAVAAVTGLTTYVIGQAFGVFSKPIARAFKDAKNALVRNTLGQPRKIMGLMCLGSKVPLIWDAIQNRQWGWLGALGCWSVGDMLAGMSKPKIDAPQRPDNSGGQIAPLDLKS